jgi:hypothetical protein
MKHLLSLPYSLQLLTLAASLLLSACFEKHSPESIDTLDEKLDENYSIYLHGDARAAENAMSSNIMLMLQSNKPDCRKASLLALAYAHLYVVQNTQGKVCDSVVTLEKFRYWSLVAGECVGRNCTELRKISEESTPQFCEEMARKWIASHTSGLSPKFMQSKGSPIAGSDQEKKFPDRNESAPPK